MMIKLWLESKATGKRVSHIETVSTAVEEFEAKKRLLSRLREPASGVKFNFREVVIS